MKKTGRVIGRVWDKLGIWLVFILIFAFLSIACDNFLSSSNLINIVRQMCVTGVVAFGAAFVVLGGEIDLSQGGVACLSGCLAAKLIVEYGINMWFAIGIVLIMGIVVGLVMGAIVTYWHVGSFITTLGFSYVLEGIVLLLTNSQPISGLPEAFLVIGRGYLGPIPVPVIILAVTFILSAFVIKYMKFGRNVLAVGENAGAAKLCGINVAKNKIAVFAVAGLASAFGGIVLASRLSSGQPSSGGDLSLQVLAAVYVGGTSSGSMSAILAGVLILQLISNGLNLFGVSGYWQKVALGIIIVLAVALDMFRLERATNRD